QIQEVAIFFLELQRGFDPDQTLDWIHVGMRTDQRGAVLDGHVENLTGPIENILALLLRLQDAGDANGLLEGAEARRHPAMQEGLFQMQMGLDEAWKGDAPFGIDLLIDLLLDLLLDGDDPSVRNANVHERLFVTDPYPADDHFHCCIPPFFS